MSLWRLLSQNIKTFNCNQTLHCQTKLSSYLIPLPFFLHQGKICHTIFCVTFVICTFVKSLLKLQRYGVGKFLVYFLRTSGLGYGPHLTAWGVAAFDIYIETFYDRGWPRGSDKISIFP